VLFCDVQGGWIGLSNLDVDPLFRDMSNDNFRLMSIACGDSIDSPGIDNGHPDYQDILLSCSWGLGTVESDMGAYGGGIHIMHSGTIINVPMEYPTIQAAIDASWHGDTVLVQPGTYIENIRYYGRNITVGSMFLLTGEFSYIDSTIVDGNDSARIVSFLDGEDSTASIIGFTLKNGYEAWNGGGIFCDHSSPRIAHNIIKDNVARHGGGIGCNYSNAIIEYNIIENNIDSRTGAGISCQNSNPLIHHNEIINNYNEGFYDGAGGIYCHSSDPIISDNFIAWNDIGGSNDGSGGIYCMYADPIIINNVIMGNISSGSGRHCGGIDFRASDAYLNNNVVYNNTGTSRGGLYISSNNTLINNTVVWGNFPTQIALGYSATIILSYSNIQDTLWPGTGNININPLFRDPANNDFHLMSVACGDSVDSPCIDAGDPNILDSLLDCSWGLGTLRSDMGAFGGGDSVSIGILDNIPLLPDRFILLQNYPNPFNAQTTIRFMLAGSRLCLTSTFKLGYMQSPSTPHISPAASISTACRRGRWLNPKGWCC
jgi:hypothetical protein